jgi:hypothetical protein
MHHLRATFVACALAIGAACARSPGDTPGAPPPGPIPPGAVPSCPPDEGPLAETLLVGFAGSDAVAARPGFHLRYQYLAGALAPSGGCLDPARADAHGCGSAWWGTWQSADEPPGAFVRDFVARARAARLLPMLSYYVLLPASGAAEGAGEVHAVADAGFLRRYLDDFRFLLAQLGCERALVHVEPDFWGYAQQEAIRSGGDATTLPAAVRSANPLDCADQPDTVAGLGRCMIAMARRWAPNARIGLHASGWATRVDCVNNRSASLDVAAKGAETGAFLAACGAAEADFVAADLADRDAGWRAAQGQDLWLDAANEVLPDFEQAFRWSRAVSDAVGRPLVWWQLPVGNMGLPDAPGAWRDNKVQYFFDHPADVVASGAIAVAFGAGEASQTTPDTDGGYLAARAGALAAAGGQPLRPDSAAQRAASAAR